MSNTERITPPKVRAVSDPPPFPDRTVSTTFWVSLCLGLIGLDHFYLRSPKTGIVKALTFGGLGLWWLWDVCQLLFEPERSAEYGLTAPFNLANGIGQGQLTTEKTHIRQRTDYFTWFLSALMDIVGITALIEGRPGAFIRRLIDGALMLAFLALGGIFGLVMAAILGFFTIAPSFFTISAIFDPERLAKKGVAMPPNLVKLLNFFESWTDIIGPNATAAVRYDVGLSAVNPQSAPNTFGYDHEEKIEAEQEAASATETGGGPKKPIISWPVSLFLGSVLGGLSLTIVNLFSLIPVVRSGLLAADGWFALVRMSRGEVPEIPGGLGGMLPPGLGGLVGNATGALATAEKSLESVKQVTGGLEKSVSGLTEKVTGGLEKGVAGLTEKVTGGLEKGVAGLTEKVTGGLEKSVSGLTEKVTGGLEKAAATLKPTEPLPAQTGGARDTANLSTESLVLGTTVLALIAGGAIKIAVDSLVTE